MRDVLVEQVRLRQVLLHGHELRPGIALVADEEQADVLLPEGIEGALVSPDGRWIVASAAEPGSTPALYPIEGGHIVVRDLRVGRLVDDKVEWIGTMTYQAASGAGTGSYLRLTGSRST